VDQGAYERFPETMPSLEEAPKIMRHDGKTIKPGRQEKQLDTG
jgi:hypothetical protein